MKISFIIPFHNEEKNAPLMIERVVAFGRRNNFDFEVVPVDDRSADDTKKILQIMQKKYREVSPVIRDNDDEEKGNTMGKALVEGTLKSKGDVIIWTMGDMTDDTNTYLAIIKKIKNGYDMVFGSRYMPGGSCGNLDRLKASLSSWGTVLARIMFGVPVHDITNAFRGFKKEVFTTLRLDSPGFSISPEFAIKAHLADFKLSEVPTIYTNRIEGVSNFKLFKMTKSYLSLYLDLFSKYKVFKTSFDFTTRSSPYD